jgi:hypothetical protein
MAIWLNRSSKPWVSKCRPMVKLELNLQILLKCSVWLLRSDPTMAVLYFRWCKVCVPVFTKIDVSGTIWYDTDVSNTTWEKG